MSITISKTGVVLRTVVIDALLLAAACLVPTASHAFSLPLYQLNPMAFCLLLGMALVGDRRNGILLAALMPVVSMLVVGMPVPAKCLCMVAELLTIVAVYALMSNRIRPLFSVLTAMLCGKVVYYLLKALIISPAVLVGTSVWLQIATIVVYGLAFAFIAKKSAD